MSRPTYTATIKPFVPETFDWNAEKATARNRLTGDWFGPPTGDVRMVEVVTIVARPDKRGELEALITYQLATAP